MRALILILAIVLSGCGGSESAEDSQTSTPTNPTDATSSNNTDSNTDNNSNTDSSTDSSNSSNSSNTNDSGDNTTTPAVTSLDEVVVPEKFDWSLTQDNEVKFRIVSNVSQIDNEPAAIGGKHFTKIIPLDENQEPLDTPIVKALTTRTGTLDSALKLQNEWYGIQVTVTVNGESCSQTIAKQDLQSIQNIGCDVETSTESDTGE